MNILYPKYRELRAGAGLNLSSATIKAVLIDTAVVGYNAAHQFFSSISAGVVGAAVTLAGKTITDGFFDADNITFLAVGGEPPTTLEAIGIYADTGNPATSPLIAFIDGRAQVRVAAAAAGGATAITLDPLPGPVASGVTLTKISGTGPATITTGGTAAAGGRSVATAALSGALSAEAVYEYAMQGAGLPVSANGGDIPVTWGAYIFA